MALQKIKEWYAKYERHISSISLIGGFVFDAVSLDRVDEFWENVWVGVHLCLAALFIIGLNVLENNYFKNKFSELVRTRMHFWFIIGVQFMFGGLLSTFIVFYFRSGSLAVSWPFFLLFALIFASNELLKHHYSRQYFQVLVLFLCLYTFSIYIVPVIFHDIGDTVFILSSAISLFIITLYILVLRIITRERFRQKYHQYSCKCHWYCAHSKWLLFYKYHSTIAPFSQAIRDLSHHNQRCFGRIYSHRRDTIPSGLCLVI